MLKGFPASWLLGIHKRLGRMTLRLYCWCRVFNELVSNWDMIRGYLCLPHQTFNIGLLQIGIINPPVTLVILLTGKLAGF